MRSVYASAEIHLGPGSRSLPGVPGSRGPKPHPMDRARPSCLESARDGIVLTCPDESLQGRLMLDARVKGRKQLPRRRGCLLLPALLMVLPQRTHMSHALSSWAVENLKPKGPPAETRIANRRLADRQPPTAGPALSTCRRQWGALFRLGDDAQVFGEKTICSWPVVVLSPSWRRETRSRPGGTSSQQGAPSPISD